MDIIVFGIGNLVKNALPFLEANYHILFLVDNNEKRWGRFFENYEMKSPEEIKKYDCAVVSAQIAYCLEIVEQLEKMGIGRERIYFCRRLGNTHHFEMIPSEMPLIRYDLCHAEEKKTYCKKVMIFCNGYSVYAKQLIENMAKRYDDIEFSLLTHVKESKGEIISERLKHIYYFRIRIELQAILEQLPVYDSMQLLWIEHEWAHFHELIRAKAKRLNLNVGGSDFYRVGTEEREYKRKLIACADGISAETLGTIREFEEYYKEDIKNEVSLLPFGIEVLECINKSENINRNTIKEKYHIPAGKLVITCGHNAKAAHQHMEIIEALDRLEGNIKEQIVCVFPLTYPQGAESYISDIINRLKETELNYAIMTEFMDFQDMAEYALISDVMIHVQTTDQLSSTMLEEMYAGSVVIAGSWLPYQSLHEMGIFFLDVDAVSGITEVLKGIVANVDEYKRKCIGNKEIIWKHSSWDELAPKWHALWE
ncbi:MAG: hypothetical protein NC489_12840 [Ruminococcus flavefaciens]|nr:hypothetical protein [Ruminococcus flavefaciens]